MQTFSFFYGLQIAIVVLSHSDNLSSSLQRAELCAVDAQKNDNISVTILRDIQSDMDESHHWTKVTQAAVKLGSYRHLHYHVAIRCNQVF